MHELFSRGAKFAGLDGMSNPFLKGTFPVEAINIVLIDENTLCEAQSCMSGCEHCAVNSSVTFDYLLDAVTNCDPTTTDYVMCRAAKCPVCSHEVTEKTRIVAD